MFYGVDVAVAVEFSTPYPCPMQSRCHKILGNQWTGQPEGATLAGNVCRKSKKPKNDLIAKSCACDKVSVRAWHQREMPPNGVSSGVAVRVGYLWLI